MFLAASLIGATAASSLAEPFHPDTLLAGVPADETGCKTIANTVWVSVDGNHDCIRYYAAGLQAGVNPKAVIYLHGDRLWGDEPISYQDNTPEQQQELVNAAQRDIDLPLITIGRPGTYGSSGSHAHRREMREVRLVNAAVLEIRKRYAIAQTGLTGQSGGAAVVAYVLTQQSNLSCVTLTSGALSMRTIIANDPVSIYNTRNPGLYDAVQHITEVATDRARSVFVIGAEGDKFSPPANQREYAEALAARGHAVRFLWGEPTGSYRHTLDKTGRAVTAWCLRGIPPEEIARRLQSGNIRG